MEEGTPGKKPVFWLYLIPLFVLAAWPAVKWMKKANSGDLNLSRDEYAAFNSEEGELRETRPSGLGRPEFDDGIMGVRYKSKAREAADEKTAAEELAASRKEAAEKRAAAAGAGTSDAARSPQTASRENTGQGAANPLRAREQQSLGFVKGMMSGAVERAMNNPKAVGAIFNNKFVVSGFMSRGTVKAATSSPEGLANYLKSGAAVNFINSPLVRAALNNPAIVSAVATSGLVSAMLETPAAKALMNDPKALGDLITSNPQLVSIAMSNPATMNMLLTNPDVSGVVNKFDTSGIRK
ncbi:MAG: hypothetical protein A2X28_04810 [Elusimicrobia bacterium GWA2_56_46]|nr:MAG: hypothetical protein A2X28_04810 [Elusimicrobia bacterium GWA2_56_46]OGR56192.1 MAG: hypothetical protein A2X39_08230 [Elusimicrobia bacterium GWC2_56_31]HBB66909.1 hypothetical protein [Elusimicrobiota bacterium]HBW23031.1 hypothetical protein [Elusimicrobiota bacterium]